MKLKRILAIILAAVLLTATLSGCGSSGTSDDTASDVAGDAASGVAGDAAAATEDDAEETEPADEDNAPDFSNASTVALSAPGYNFDAEYFYSDYNAASNADTDRQDGIDTFADTDIVFQSLNWEQLVYLLQQEGNYLILLGGSWCHNTRAAISYINDYAHEYGIDTIYNFDFRLDGATVDTHIRVTNGDSAAAVAYNHMYGELVSRYLTNLTDWVEYTTDSESAATYTNAGGEDVTVAKVQVPFLFLYNKDNTVDNSGNEGEDGSYPIVYGFEEMVERDSQGVYVFEEDEEGNRVTDDDGNDVRNYITDEYLERLRGTFKYIRDNGVNLDTFSDADYVRTSFNEQAEAELFADGDTINFNVISYRQLHWLLEQEGNALLLLGGPWCPNTQAVINTVNDYAVANDAVVYFADLTLDGAYPRKFWNYEGDAQVRATGAPLESLYTDLVEQYLTNLTTIYDVDSDEDYQYIAYTNDSGSEVRVRKLQVPYLLAYNKDAADADGFAAPITGYHEQMLVLTPDEEDYIYGADNYAAYKAGTLGVFKAYAAGTGGVTQDISIDRSAS